MPYNGPSKGCAICKRRHVKCDEGRPQCSNCQKLGLSCPGYNDGLIVLFHDEGTQIRRKPSNSNCSTSSVDESSLVDGSNSNSQRSSELSSPSSTTTSSSYQPTKKKRYAPKVKTGCLTCKKRRVKCDETKPACKRCQALGKTCEYLPVKTWIFDSHDQMRRSSTSSTNSQEDSPGRSVMPFYGTTEEKRYLDSFLRFTAPWLSRYVPSDFFQVVLPRSSWQHPALRHGLVSVAMATEEARLPSGTLDSRRKNWHYYQALRSLSSDNSVNMETILLTCMMFWLHDNISNRSESAMTHLVGALKIINEWRAGQRTQGSSSDLISSSIEPTLLYGLVFSAATSDKNCLGPYDPQTTTAIRERLANAKYIHQYDNMEEVRNELGFVVRSFPYAVKRHVPDQNNNIDDSRPTFSELRIFLEKWFRAFSRVTTGVTSADKKLLECHYICATVSVDSYEFGVSSKEMTDPKGMARFDYMLDQIESISSEDLVQAPFARDVHLAIIPLLTSVARLCPDGELKIRAMRQLRNMDRVEGLWNSAVAAELLERIEEIDEKIQSSTPHESAILLTPLNDTSHFFAQSQAPPLLEEVEVG